MHHTCDRPAGKIRVVGKVVGNIALSGRVCTTNTQRTRMMFTGARMVDDHVSFGVSCSSKHNEAGGVQSFEHFEIVVLLTNVWVLLSLMSVFFMKSRSSILLFCFCNLYRQTHGSGGLICSFLLDPLFQTIFI